MKLTDFDIYSNLMKEKSGLVLTEDKVYMLESRLNPIAKKWGYNSLETMTIALQGVPDKNLVTDIVEAMMTSETSFFRDIHPFDTFKNDLLGYMREARGRNKKLRIWCAAASSGQEPYSLSMMLKEAEDNTPGWNYEILATDISRDILDQARSGLYTQYEVQRGLPIRFLLKYFTQIEAQKWQINQDIKNNIKFQQFNLLDPMADLGTFDFIFCRNVLSYFDKHDKNAVLNRIVQRLAPDGYLILGQDEEVEGFCDALVSLPDHEDVFVSKDHPHIKDNKQSSARSSTQPLKPTTTDSVSSNRFSFSSQKNSKTKS